MALDPTVTLPKASVVGLAASCRLDWVVPAPVNCTVDGEFAALLEKFALPDTDPVPLGVNLMVTARLLPAPIVTGRVIPTTENCELVD